MILYQEFFAARADACSAAHCDVAFIEFFEGSKAGSSGTGLTACR